MGKKHSRKNGRAAFVPGNEGRQRDPGLSFMHALLLRAESFRLRRGTLLAFGLSVLILRVGASVD